MALSGTILAVFVFGHMIGNLQMFQSPDHINNYAHFLQHLPFVSLWSFRAVMLASIGVHIATGLSLYLENRTARPANYEVKRTRVATFAARTMPVTGIIIALFAAFHLVHFTVKPECGSSLWFGAHKYADYHINATGDNHVFQLFNAFAYNIGPNESSHDVYNMVVDAFAIKWVSGAYILAIILIFTHLTHGCTSLFQSIGLRNERWRKTLSRIAIVYAIVVGAGFIAPAAGVLTGLVKNQNTDSPRGSKFPVRVICCEDCDHSKHPTPLGNDTVQVTPAPADAPKPDAN